MNSVLSEVYPEDRLISSFFSPKVQEKSLSITRIIDPYQSDNLETLNFCECIEEISKDFSEYIPKEIVNFPNFTINDYHVVSEVEILFLLYKNASLLHYYKVGLEFKMQAIVTEDSLQTLIVDSYKKIAIVGAGLFENRVFIYNLENLDLLNTLTCDNSIKSIASSLSHSFLVTVNFDTNVNKWNLDTLNCESLIPDNYQFISICDNKGWIALATNYGKLTYFADKKYEIKEPLRLKRVRISIDGTYVAIHTSKVLYIYKLSNQALEKIDEKSFDKCIIDLTYNSNDALLITLVDGTMIIWQHSINRLPIYLFLEKVVRAKFAEDMKIYCSTSFSHSLCSINPPYLPQIHEITNTTATAFSLDGYYFCYADKCILKCLNQRTGKIDILYTFHHEIIQIAFIGSETILVVSKAFINLFSLESSTNQMIKNIDDDYVNSIAIDHETSKIYIAGSGKKIKVFHTDPFEFLNEFGYHQSDILSLHLFRNKSMIASRDLLSVKIWDLLEYSETFKLEEKGIDCVILSKDDEYLIVSKNEDIIVVDIKSKDILHKFSIGKGYCLGMYHTKNFKYLIISSTDQGLCFWDFSTFTYMFNIKVQGEITNLEVSGDEKYISYKISLKTTNYYVIENPLKDIMLHYYTPQTNYLKFVQYVLDIKDRKRPVYDHSMDFSIIMPYKITLLHIYAFYGLNDHIKLSLMNGAGLSDDINGSSPLDLSIKRSHKVAVIKFLRFVTKNLASNPFIGRIFNLETLISLNFLNLSVLKSFYDALLQKNHLAILPLSIESKYRLPKFYCSEEIIPKKSWFFLETAKEEGTYIQFYTSVISLNTYTGSEDSIKFLKSLMNCEQSDIFRTKFIQHYIDHKWHRLRMLFNIECAVYVCYLSLLSALAFTGNNSNINAVLYILGLIFYIFEIFQIFGGLQDYIKDKWNIIDFTRFVLLIIYGNSDSLGKNYTAALLSLSLVSWTKGISYFRLVSYTRYMIYLITEVLKDIFPFLVIAAYSTIAFTFLFMLMNLDGPPSFPTYFQISYLNNLGQVNSYNYTTTQWICFIIDTILNPVIMFNLIISIMQDTNDKVQESREVADYKEKLALVMKIEIAAIWRRKLSNHQKFHVCKELETDKNSRSWLEKLREIKNMMSGLKQSQSNIIESNNKIISDNLLVREQMAKIEKMLLGLKDKLVTTSEGGAYEVTCLSGHKLTYRTFFEINCTCTRCKKKTEAVFYCPTCNYILCKSCYKIIYKEKVGKNDITCYRSHKLSWISDHSQYLDYEKKVFPCVGCKKSLFKDTYNCKICKWDICFKCVDIICSKIPIAWSKQCASNHSLAWHSRPNSISYKCNICLQSFSKSGSFRCEICDYNACIRCFDDLT
jgi:WD40 repeat protein